MKRIVVGFCLIAGSLALPGAAFAQSRPSTMNMTCAQAQGLVRSSGAIVVGTGGASYDRYVAGNGFCQRDEMAVPAWAPSRDSAQCFIGYTCESRSGRDPSPP